MLRERITPHSEAIRVIFWEDSPCCGGPRTSSTVMKAVICPSSASCSAAAAAASAPASAPIAGSAAGSIPGRGGFGAGAGPGRVGGPGADGDGGE